MIDISLYEQKLTWLREWVNSKIDGNCPTMIDCLIAMDVLPQLPFDEVMKLYYQTGVIFYRSGDPQMSHSHRPMNFQEYIQYKQSIQWQK